LETRIHTEKSDMMRTYSQLDNVESLKDVVIFDRSDTGSVMSSQTRFSVLSRLSKFSRASLRSKLTTKYSGIRGRITNLVLP